MHVTTESKDKDKKKTPLITCEIDKTEKMVFSKIQWVCKKEENILDASVFRAFKRFVRGICIQSVDNYVNRKQFFFAVVYKQIDGER